MQNIVCKIFILHLFCCFLFVFIIKQFEYYAFCLNRQIIAADNSIITLYKMATSSCKLDCTNIVSLTSDLSAKVNTTKRSTNQIDQPIR